MNWAQGGVRDQLKPVWHSHTDSTDKKTGQVLFLRISVAVFRSFWQKEPDSDVNWSKVFPRSYLNLITPKEAAPVSHSLCKALLLSLEPSTVYYFPNFSATTQSIAAQQPPNEPGLQNMWLSLKIKSSGNTGRGAGHGLCISEGECWLNWPRNSF